MFKIVLKLVDFEGIKNQFKVLSYIWSYFWSLWASWTFLTGAGVKEWWHCLTLLEICLFEGIKNQFKVWSYLLRYFWRWWALWTFLTGASIKEWWHCCRFGGCLRLLTGTGVLEWGYVLQAPLSLGFKFCEGLMARSWDMKLKLVWNDLVESYV